MPHSHKVCILGASGAVGSALVQAFSPNHRVYGTFRRNRPWIRDCVYLKLDVHVIGDVVDFLRVIKPDHVFYAVGIADEAKCRSETRFTTTVNIDAALAAAQTVEAWGGSLTYFSSAKVFSGAEGHYVEDDAVRPISIYGSQKVAAEEKLAQLPNVLILRLGNVFGLSSHPGGSFFMRILEDLWSGKRARYISDEYRSFTSSAEVAHSCLRLVEDEKLHPGIFHLSTGDRTSYYDLARHLAERFSLPSPAFTAQSSKEYDIEMGAKSFPRGFDLSLSGKHFESTFGFTPIDWKRSLDRFALELARGGW